MANGNRNAFLKSTLVDPNMFWVLVLVVWMAGQIPVLGQPFRLLATWVHELGHGLGAIISGGSFDQMIITPQFSGLAHTFTGNDWERVVVLLGGLLGPAIAGAVMLILSRRLDQSRLALFLLAGALVATLFLWAGDNFTRMSMLGFALVVSLIAFKAWPWVVAVSAHIIALAFCLNAVADFSYFFMNSADVGNYAGKSDTSALAEIIGGPHLFWALVPSVLSILILYGAFRLSNGGKRA
ncbi:MAG: M50 family metallopeptidase [Robiginitomaculum sp.]|nr:M50 family metallopeptidase [Robiginitomaculum sp.]